ncbi:MAG: tRNA pseudouridine(38-40) synthase TruA [Verrucomicrobiota bacterium]
MNQTATNDLPPEGHIRLRLQIAYDGTGFDGWQSQPHGRTVQDALERAFAELVGRRVVIHGSGRTDAGVHALAQIAHVDVPEARLTPEAWVGALNARLSPLVRVVSSKKAAAGFHARFSATGKVYSYRVWNDRVMRPTEVNRAWHAPIPADLAILRHAAELLVGTHDFAPFSAKRHPGETDTIRTIHQIHISKSGPLITLRFEGNGFLYRMVRLLTGSLIRVATGKSDAQWLQSFLTNPTGPRSSFCADAEGLYLTRVLYGSGGKIPKESRRRKSITEAPHSPRP